MTLLTGFRNYLHYHLKATKTYMHMRMRKRVVGLLQGEFTRYGSTTVREEQSGCLLFIAVMIVDSPTAVEEFVSRFRSSYYTGTVVHTIVVLSCGFVWLASAVCRSLAAYCSPFMAAFNLISRREGRY